ncbi:MAG: 2-C-methyl-D-erythritol 4-phosphate cytidylyltransferase [Candidatus Eiseniibacteriota bacterium]|nr:MAG: 2-C-methyl-D-erythritol 4-phosphate cytidylyltransferase [Candidatus Eisenbacteria bacterium]
MPSRRQGAGRKARAAAIVVAAGEGRRFGRKGGKPFSLLGGKPLLFYCLKALEISPEIERVVLVVRKDALKKCLAFVRRSGFKKVDAVVAGGRRRQDSVLAGLAFVGDSKFVLVHDAARPFLDRGLVAKTLAAARKNGAAIAAIPVTDTVKKVAGRSIQKTIPREGLWLAQTPQVFRTRTLEEAFRRWPSARTATDDASVVRSCGGRVSVVEGDPANIKITIPSDLALAESLLRFRKRPWE